DDPLEPVRRPDANSISGPDAPRDEGAGSPMHEVGQLAVCGSEALVPDDQGLAVAESFDGAQEGPGGRLAPKRHRRRAMGIGEGHRHTQPNRRTAVNNPRLTAPTRAAVA